MLALLDPGDEVIYPDPGFPIYRSIARFIGATPVPIPLLEERGFSFDLDAFRDSLSGRTKMVILNSPQNPTGGVIPDQDLREIARLIRDRDLIVLSDEIYSRIFYTAEPPGSIASLDGMESKTIILDGFFKIVRDDGLANRVWSDARWIAEAVNKLMVNSNSCTASFTQSGGPCGNGRLSGVRGTNGGRVSPAPRSLLPGVERSAGFRCAPPAGAFYAFVQCEGDGNSFERNCGLSLGGCGRGLSEWRFLWSVRRGIHSLQLCQFNREPDGSRSTHSRGIPVNGQGD